MRDKSLLSGQLWNEHTFLFRQHSYSCTPGIFCRKFFFVNFFICFQFRSIKMQSLDSRTQHITKFVVSMVKVLFVRVLQKVVDPVGLSPHQLAQLSSHYLLSGHSKRHANSPFRLRIRFDFHHILVWAFNNTEFISNMILFSKINCVLLRFLQVCSYTIFQPRSCLAMTRLCNFVLRTFVQKIVLKIDLHWIATL